MKYTALEFDITAANCPFCGAYSSFTWGDLSYKYMVNQKGPYFKEINYDVGECNHCKNITFWEEYWDSLSKKHKLIYPIKGIVSLPNVDLPDDIKRDYLEASDIVELSPRGAVALLRLALQKLCKHLGESGKDINKDIGALVKKGLNPSIQKALDSVRVTGNNAVHPGTIDLTDDRETAYKIFGFINIIANTMITQPKEIEEFYNMTVTGTVKEAIEKRDYKS